jgi:hypothetical protein
MAEAWTVRLEPRVRPLVEAIAREEQRVPAQVVRRLLDHALTQRASNSRGMDDQVVARSA